MLMIPPRRGSSIIPFVTEVTTSPKPEDIPFAGSLSIDNRYIQTMLWSLRSKSNLFAALALLFFTNNVASAKKLAKVKAGIVYKPKDDIHIIVNSVG